MKYNLSNNCCFACTVLVMTSVILFNSSCQKSTINRPKDVREIPEYADWSSCELMNTNFLSRIFEAGLSPNAKDSYGSTLLCSVMNIDKRWTRREGGESFEISYSEEDKLPIVEYLIRNGASAAVRDRAGDTPLEQSILKGYIKITLLLLDSKVLDLYSPELLQLCLKKAERVGHDPVIFRLRDVIQQKELKIELNKGTHVVTPQTNQLNNAKDAVK